MRRIAIPLAVLALAGCGHSPPTRFFALETATPTGPRPGTAGPITPVQLSGVHIPPALDRPQLVRELGGGRLDIRDRDHWAAPLGRLLQRALAQGLFERLPLGGFVPPEAPKPANARTLTVDVLELRTDRDGRSDLQGSWTLLAGRPARTLLSQSFTLSAEGAPDAAGQAAATSRLFGELADQIDAAVIQDAPR